MTTTSNFTQLQSSVHCRKHTVLLGKEASGKLVNMVLNVHRNHKGRMGGRGYGDGGRGRVYTYRYTVIPRMTWIKIGSDESHFNISLIVRDKVTRPCPQTRTFLKIKENRSGIESRSFRLPAYRLKPVLNWANVSSRT